MLSNEKELFYDLQNILWNTYSGDRIMQISLLACISSKLTLETPGQCVKSIYS